jgi:hypothetical protein
MKTQSTTVLVLVIAAITSTTLMAAPASPASQYGADTSSANCLPVIPVKQAPEICLSTPSVSGPIIEGEIALSTYLPFAARAVSSSSCLCSQGACCGCNPCPPTGMGECCSWDLGGGLCGALRVCVCLNCPM